MSSSVGSSKSSSVPGPCDCGGYALFRAGNLYEGRDDEGVVHTALVWSFGPTMVESHCTGPPVTFCVPALPNSLPEFANEVVRSECSCCPGCEWWWKVLPESARGWVNIAGEVPGQVRCSWPQCGLNCPEPAWTPADPETFGIVLLGKCGEAIPEPGA
jgi:hypothetical protein